MKFVRREDLTSETRFWIGVQAFFNKGYYGAMTDLALKYRCSRTFIYQQLHIFIAFFSWYCSRFEPENYCSIDNRDWKRLVLLMRLELRASIKSISRALPLLGEKNCSVGHLSQTLKEWGGVLRPTLSSETIQRVIVLSDEIFAGGKPILITVDPHSLAILQIRLGPDRSANIWSESWELLNREGFYIEGLVSDRGQGLRGAAKMLEIPWFSDHFHEFRDLVKAIRTKVLNRALQAIDGKLNNRNAEIYQLIRETPRLIDSFDHHEYLLNYLLYVLPPVDGEGNLRSIEWVTGEVTAVLELLIELNDKDVKPIAEKLRKQLTESLKYFEIVSKVEATMEKLGLPEEVKQGFCLLWKHERAESVTRGKCRKYHRGEKETWESLLQWEFGEEYGKLKELIFQELDSIPRASSLVESVNSRIRSYLDSCQGKITQETLNLIMFFHNHHPFSEGRRKGKAPIEILTGEKLKKDWLELLLERLP